MNENELKEKNLKVIGTVSEDLEQIQKEIEIFR